MTQNKKFRINAKKVFLTYPQCGDLTREDVLEMAKLYGPINSYTIGLEKHQDGNNHIHAAISYGIKLDITDPHGFDVKGHHGNYQGAKKWPGVVAYCAKGGNFITNTILDMSTPDNYVKRKRDFTEWKKDLNAITMDEVKIELRLWQKFVIEKVTGPWEKRKIYWIWSHESGTGKSTLMDYCCATLKLNILPADEPNLKDILYAYSNQNIIWFDITRDNSSQYKNVLEKLSNGGMMLSTKYESCTKIVKAHIVVCSNEEPPHHLLPNRIHEIKATI